MSHFLGRKKPLGYMHDMFIPTGAEKKRAAEAPTPARGTESANPINTINSALTAVVADSTQVLLLHTNRGAGGQPDKGQQQQAYHSYTPHQKRPFWSLLLCQPEVFDPYIEAAPGAALLALCPESDPPKEEEEEVEESQSVADSILSPLDSGTQEVTEGLHVVSSNHTRNVSTQGSSHCVSELSSVGDHTDNDDGGCGNGDGDGNGSGGSAWKQLLQPAVNTFHVHDTRVMVCRHSLNRTISCNVSLTGLLSANSEGHGTGDDAACHDEEEEDEEVRMAARRALLQREIAAETAREEAVQRERRWVQDLAAKKWRRTGQATLAVKATKEKKAALRAMIAEEELAQRHRRQRRFLEDYGDDGHHGDADGCCPILAGGATAAATTTGSAFLNSSLMASSNSSFECGSSLVTLLDDETVESQRHAAEVIEHRARDRADAFLRSGGHGETLCSRAESTISFSSSRTSPALLSAAASGGDGGPAAAAAVLSTAAVRAFALPSRYPLGSRAYMERVLLAQRGQQVHALMALLTESHRHAWQHYLRLIQLYHYYVNPILNSNHALGATTSSSSAAGNGEAVTTPVVVPSLEASLLAYGSRAAAAYHGELRQSASDYQYLTYAFNAPWQQLFLCVRHYLNVNSNNSSGGGGKIDGGDDEIEKPQSPKAAGENPNGSEYNAARDEDEEEGESEAPAPSQQPPEGAVCFAATLLHSMELFERHRPLQTAARDVEEWLREYYKQDEMNKENCCADEGKSNGVHGAMPVTDTAATTSTATAVKTPQHYVPMQWATAQEEAMRVAVYWARRQCKLDAMEAAERSLWRHRRHHHHGDGGDSCLDDDDTATVDTDGDSSVEQGGEPPQPPSRSASASGASRGLSSTKGSFSTAAHLRRAYADMDAALPPETYRVVNVGCFGFSFRSLFD